MTAWASGFDNIFAVFRKFKSWFHPPSFRPLPPLRMLLRLGDEIASGPAVSEEAQSAFCGLLAPDEAWTALSGVPQHAIRELLAALAPYNLGVVEKDGRFRLCWIDEIAHQISSERPGV